MPTRNNKTRRATKQEGRKVNLANAIPFGTHIRETLCDIRIITNRVTKPG